MGHEKKIEKILLIDDEPIVHHAISLRLKVTNEYSLIDTLRRNDSPFQQVLEYRPDIVILDLCMPDKDGVSILEKIIEELPAQKIIIFTSVLELDTVAEIFKKGAKGYLTKKSSQQDLLDAIKIISAGGVYLDPIMLKKTDDQSEEYIKALIMLWQQKKLTDREKEVVIKVSQGLSSRLIAKELNISYRTVYQHRVNIYKKLDINSTQQLVSYAYRTGLIT